METDEVFSIVLALVQFKRLLNAAADIAQTAQAVNSCLVQFQVTVRLIADKSFVQDELDMFLQ